MLYIREHTVGIAKIKLMLNRITTTSAKAGNLRVAGIVINDQEFEDSMLAVINLIGPTIKSSELIIDDLENPYFIVDGRDGTSYGVFMDNGVL